MSLPLIDKKTVRFHLSLNVSDLSRSVDFFRVLLGVEPAKRRDDYAKFEPDEPPLVLSLEPHSKPGPHGVLNHAGFRMPDAASLVAMQMRLEQNGVRSQREDGVECCYAKQTKFWVRDPDDTLWEVYTLDGDIEHRGGGSDHEHLPATQAGGCGPATVCANPKAGFVYEHRMNAPMPERIPHDDGTLDEVHFRGTFNLPMPDTAKRGVLAEAMRTLKPGGRVFVHVLTGDAPLEGPDLPGPAAAVRFVPTYADAVASLEAAGLTRVNPVKYGKEPCFVRKGVSMRETQLEAWKPAS